MAWFLWNIIRWVQNCHGIIKPSPGIFSTLAVSPSSLCHYHFQTFLCHNHHHRRRHCSHQHIVIISSSIIIIVGIINIAVKSNLVPFKRTFTIWCWSLIVTPDILPGNVIHHIIIAEGENVARYTWYHVPSFPDRRFMGPTWVPSGADRTQVGPMLAPWNLLSGSILDCRTNFYRVLML